MLNKLREATKILHEEIERENLAARIMSHQITTEEYRLLLLQNYTAYYITENEISPHFSEFDFSKNVQLQNDLNALDLDAAVAENYRELFKINNKAEALGAAYVVEGSALGGMMISAEIKKCPNLSSIETHHFFNGDRQNIKNWRKFCSIIKKEKLSPLEEEQAVKKAKETFLFFGKIFQEVQLQSAS